MVENILVDLKPSQLLDFACGTGRVLACVEPLARTVDGIDISENMVAVARKRCQRARLQERLNIVLKRRLLLLAKLRCRLRGRTANDAGICKIRRERLLLLRKLRLQINEQ